MLHSLSICHCLGFRSGLSQVCWIVIIPPCYTKHHIASSLYSVQEFILCIAFSYFFWKTETNLSPLWNSYRGNHTSKFFSFRMIVFQSLSHVQHLRLQVPLSFTASPGVCSDSCSLSQWCFLQNSQNRTSAIGGRRSWLHICYDLFCRLVHHFFLFVIFFPTFLSVFIKALCCWNIETH